MNLCSVFHRDNLPFKFKFLIIRNSMSALMVFKNYGLTVRPIENFKVFWRGNPFNAGRWRWPTLSLLSSAFGPTIFPPSMPCNSTAQAENELMEMSRYDTDLRALRSSSSSGFVPIISEFDHLNTCSSKIIFLRLSYYGDHYPSQGRRVDTKRCMKTLRSFYQAQKYKFPGKSTKSN